MSILVKVGASEVPFDLWRPGVVLPGALISFDSETKMASPGAVPRPVIAAATDGAQGFFIAVPHLAAFVDAHRQKKWLMHNAAFDLAVLENCGVSTNDLVESGRLFDTGLLYRLLKLADRGSCHGKWSLDHVCSELLGLVLPKDERASDGRVIRTSFARFLKTDGTVDYPTLLRPENRVYLNYAGRDPVATLLAAQRMNEWAQLLFDSPNLDLFTRQTYSTVPPQDGIDVGHQWKIYGFQTLDIQLRGAIALAAISRRGMHVDHAAVSTTIAEIDRQLADIKKTLHERYKWAPGQGSQSAFNANLARLENELGEKLPKTESGEFFSRCADDLEEFRERSEFIDLYLTHEALTKIRNTFLRPLDNASTVVYGRFNELVNTGRASCSGKRDEDGDAAGLNLQNIPKEGGIRESLTAGPDELALGCDYVTLELVTLAQHCLKKYGQSKVAEAIQRDADLHAAYACFREGIDISKYEKWDKKTLMPLLGPDGDKLRDQAKPVNFGYPGGLGSKSFVHYAKSSYGIGISDDDAKQEKEKWLTTWPEMVLHLTDSAVLEFVQRFPQFWTGHPKITLGEGFPPDEIPWTFHIFKGVLAGRTKTLTSQRTYTPKEISWAWFAAKWIAKSSSHLSDTERTILNTRIKERIAGQDLLEMIIPAQRFVSTLTGRLRGFPAYCAAKNTVFQGLAADGAKRALYRLHREGFKVINFIHDEVLVAVREDSDCTVAAERVQRIMIEEMQVVVPDLPVKCEFALMRRWYKGAKAMYVDGKLVPVKPVVIDGKTKWIHDEK